MTDLKRLLADAAGDEPAVTDDHLAADLRRGQTSLRRRRLAGVISGTVATALVIGAGYAVLPGLGSSAGAPLDSGVAAQTTPTPSPSRTLSEDQKEKIRRSEAEANLPRVPKPAKPVPLVADGKVRPGTDLVCDLMPKGWEVKVWNLAGNESELIITDPNLKNPTKYNKTSTRMRVRHAAMINNVPEKYGELWVDLQHFQAGEREAVVAPVHEPASDGTRDIHMKLTNTKLLQVTANATGLGWDLATVLRFTGSCRY
ncbi:hypothetical protein OG394_39835 [Kribbella sp. NBC_01245]|uniref:hypothetical protein n=1 Tax=Kribbella sp. NBC_01245 TaxID=2903578 RepID=UPI002E2D1CAE|nr:hypothetical protein [Kribbella sp. NBC_01245]